MCLNVSFLIFDLFGITFITYATCLLFPKPLLGLKYPIGTHLIGSRSLNLPNCGPFLDYMKQIILLLKHKRTVNSQDASR